MTPNTLYFGDNLAVLREEFEDECVDLIYLDPPFNSKRDYNYIYSDIAGEGDTAQVQAFADTWSFEGASDAFYEATELAEPVSHLLNGLQQAFGETSLLGYLSVMALRLRELHRVLKPTGSLYLHCDDAANNELKVVLDAIFGTGCYKNEIIWKRTSGHSDARGYGRAHDNILFYTKGGEGTWNPTFQPYEDSYVSQYYRYKDPDGRRFMSGDASAAGLTGGGYTYEWKGVTRTWRYPEETMRRLDNENRIYYTRNGIARVKRYLDESDGLPAQDVWADVEALRSWHAERLGYPTQKPLALLERIIAASSNEGDLVLDPFCGCGTAVVAAQKLGRQWCGIDITTLAVSLIKRRLLEHFPADFPDADSIPVIGLPADLAGAQKLAQADRYMFEHWALTLIGAAPKAPKSKSGRKGADRGIDGEFSWRDGQDNPQRGIVSVKSGHVTVSQLRDLIGTMQREKAQMGLFLTLEEPTGPMRKEAAAAGRYQPAGLPNLAFPTVQIVTIEQLLAGHEPELPRWRMQPFREAKRLAGRGDEQGSLFDDD